MFSPQRSVYLAFLHDKEHLRCLEETQDPFLLKKRWEAFYEREKRKKMLRVARCAYAHLQVEEQEKKQFRFRSSHPVWGCDEHGYGWNLLGRAVQPASPIPSSVFRLLIPLLRELVQRLHRGDPLHGFFHLTVAEMRASLDIKEHVDKEEIREWSRMVEDEVAYPGSLVHLIRKDYAPLLNGLFQESINKLLQEGALLLADEYHLHHGTQRLATPEWKDTLVQNLRFLYQHRKLPLTMELLEKIEFLESRSWAEEQVRQAVAFVPRSTFSSNVVEWGETDHPIFSPLAPQTLLEEDGRSFPHVWAYIYYHWLVEYLPDPDEAYRRVLSMEDWSKADRVVEKAQGEFMESLLRRHVNERLREKQAQWQFLTNPSLVEFHDPYDPVLSRAMQRILRETRTILGARMTQLCRWVAPQKTVHDRDFCAYHALQTNLRLWKGLLASEDTEHDPVRILYGKKTLHQAFRTCRIQSPENVLQRMEEAWKGTTTLDFLEKKKAQAMVARLVHHACFPQQVFSRQPRSFEWENAQTDFFKEVARLL
uniref:Uncharacterized protein n=1 Tax=viral metagenome TaxID=1070528 RepID=A0A6C0ID91_9ZZZZ